jgi:hypothetical protein
MSHSSNAHRRRLSELRDLPLAGVFETIWETAQATCGGPAACRRRLIAEAHDLLALAQLSDRLVVHWLDLSMGLRAKVEMDVPVPCLPDPSGPLSIAPRATLGVGYPQEAVFVPQQGFAFVRILKPQGVWLSAISPDENQALCLGHLPAGVPVSEILLMTYGALSLQTIQIDLLDSAGVLNPAAAVWWQQNASRIPLTREPFLRDEVPHAH